MIVSIFVKTVNLRELNSLQERLCRPYIKAENLVNITTISTSLLHSMRAFQRTVYNIEMNTFIQPIYIYYYT